VVKAAQLSLRVDEEWITGAAVERGGLAAYAPDRIARPPRPREARQAEMGKAGAATHWRSLAKAPVSQWRERIVALLGDGKARTFNAIAVELCDMTADVAPDNADEALWALVADGQLEHTREAPVLFRLRSEAA
jgi:hypothetical protein